MKKTESTEYEARGWKPRKEDPGFSGLKKELKTVLQFVTGKCLLQSRAA